MKRKSGEVRNMRVRHFLLIFLVLLLVFPIKNGIIYARDKWGISPWSIDFWNLGQWGFEPYLVWWAPLDGTLDLRVGRGEPEFYRTTPASYIDPDTGLLKWARGNRENLVHYSEELDNSYWAKSHVSITVDAGTFSDGEHTAEGLIADTVNTIHYIAKWTVSTDVSEGDQFVSSIYVKSGLFHWVRLMNYYRDNSNNILKQCHAYFNLNNISSIGSYGNIDAYGYKAVGNGWYRIYIVDTAPAGVYNIQIQVAIAENSGDVVFIGDGTSVYLYVGRIQVEKVADLESPEPGPYTKTTNTTATIQAQPRFEMVNGRKMLLLEDESTNDAHWSEELDKSTYWNYNYCSVSSDLVTAPDGNDTADGLIPSADNNTHSIYIYPGSYDDNQMVTQSIFVKPNTSVCSGIKFSLRKKDGSWVKIYFYFNTMTINPNDGKGGIIPLLNGWYKCWWSVNVGAGTSSPGFYFAVLNISNQDQFAGDGTTVYAYFWGAQIEKKPFLTSYIKTTDAATTRSAENGDALEHGLYWPIDPTLYHILNSGQGTLLCDVVFKMDSDQNETGNHGIVSVRGSVYSILYVNLSESKIKSYDGTSTSAVTSVEFSQGDLLKLGTIFKYQDNGIKFQVFLKKNSSLMLGTVQPFDGSFNPGTYLYLHRGSAYPMYIGNIRFYSKAFNQNYIDKILSN